MERGEKIDLVKQKMEDALALAKSKIKPPIGIITVKDEESSLITVEKVNIGTEEWIYIFRSSLNPDQKRDTLYKNKKDKFRTIIFINCKNSSIVLTEKMLKITFLYCENCQVFIRGGSIGPVEIIKCSKINVEIKNMLSGHDVENLRSESVVVPIIQTDMSDDIHFYQHVNEIVYVICGCSNVTGVLIKSSTDNIKHYPMLCSIFGEQNFILFSKKQGIVQIQERYILNDIEQHLVFSGEKTEII